MNADERRLNEVTGLRVCLLINFGKPQIEVKRDREKLLIRYRGKPQINADERRLRSLRSNPGLWVHLLSAFICVHLRFNLFPWSGRSCG